MNDRDISQYAETRRNYKKKKKIDMNEIIFGSSKLTHLNHDLDHRHYHDELTWLVHLSIYLFFLFFSQSVLHWARVRLNSGLNWKIIIQLKIKLYKDGKKWCVTHWGDVCGFLRASMVTFIVDVGIILMGASFCCGASWQCSSSVSSLGYFFFLSFSF